jgi:asparagine N-glycosylation enzyme membrane subunit Stt3
MTFLELINDVLIRLRETQVSTNAETGYSTLIGKFVNDAKRQVEDAFSWNILGTDITITTVAATYQYSLTGAGQKFQVQDAINSTANIGLTNISFVEMNRFQNFAIIPAATIPSMYSFEGVDGSGDTKVTLYPRPDAVYSIRFSLTVPQATLAADGTAVLVPDVLVAQNAYARALAERGEDGGLTSSEAYQLYRTMLSDYIALEGTRYPENQEFVAI